MEMSPNREHLWVCVYNKNADTELKGKLLVVNPATMTVEKVFPGISALEVFVHGALCVALKRF